MMEITVKVVMENLGRIEQSIENEAEADNTERLVREAEIRQSMREDHAKQLLLLGVDMEIISKAIGLRMEYLQQLRDEIEG